MRALLTSLINIAQRTGRFTVAQATDIYNGLWRILGFALFACVAAFMLNAGLGWKMPSLVLAIAFAVVAIYVWAKPLHILVVAGLGGLARRIATDASLLHEVENILVTYLGFLKWVLLAGVTFLFITGTVPFKENPGAMLPVLVGLGVVGLFSWAWPTIFVGRWGRKLVYWYAITVIALSFGNLIPGAVWAKYTGWDPATIKPTATADGLYRLDKAVREEADKVQAEKLELVRNKISRREALTKDDEKVIAEVRQSVNAKSSAPAHATAEPVQQRRKVSFPAYGETQQISVRYGYAPVFTGSGFELRCVYTDGSEDVGSPTHPCRDGSVRYVVARDTSGQPNSVVYEFVQADMK